MAARPAAAPLARLGPLLLLRSAPPWADHRPGRLLVAAAAWGGVQRRGAAAAAASAAAAAAAEAAPASSSSSVAAAAAAAADGRATSSSPQSAPSSAPAPAPAAAAERGRERSGQKAGAAPPGAAAADAAADAAAIPEVVGRVQSVESFSAVDGPGIRMVVFTSGCAMRCVFCSNPDTWSAHGGEPTSSKEIAARLCRLRPFLAPGGGGVTCSGGEPLLQPDFVSAVFREARALGLTTVLDTTGQGTKRHNWDAVLPHTDLALFCVKSLDPRKYALLTGLKQRGALRFAEELLERRVPFWVRYVLIPGWSDGDGDIAALGAWARDLYVRGGGGGGWGGAGTESPPPPTPGDGESPEPPPPGDGESPEPPPPVDPPPSPVLQGIELLPYHVLGRAKWLAMGLKYPLEGVATPKPAAVLPVVRRLRRDFGLPVLCSVDEHTAGAAGGSSAVDVDPDDAGHARHIGPRAA